MKSFLSFCAMLFSLGCIVALLVVVAPDKFEPVIKYLGILGPSVPNCSDERTANLLYELLSKQISQVNDKGHLSKDNFQLVGITTVSSENQGGKFYPTKFTCQAYLNVNLSPKALTAISDLKKQRRDAENPIVQAMGLGVLLPNPELLESTAEVNIEGQTISQSFQYTTQMDDALTYQSVTAKGLPPVATLIAFLTANGFYLGNETTESISPNKLPTSQQTLPTENTESPDDKNAPLVERKIVKGLPITVSQNRGDKSFTVTVGDTPVIQNNDGYFGVSIQGTYEDGTKAYVLIAENSGGNAACTDSLQAIDLSSTKPIVSPTFEDCYGASATISNGALVIRDTTPREIYITTFYEGKLSKKTEKVSYEPAGPTAVPNGDIATYVAPMTADEVFKLRVAVDSLKRALPEAAFNEVRDLAIDWPGHFTDHKSFVMTSACQPHNCGPHQMRIIFDHTGNAYASILNDSGLSFYGSPPDQILHWLNPDTPED